jgi:hypothetical protein
MHCSTLSSLTLQISSLELDSAAHRNTRYAFTDLQEKRHSADYDPLYRVTSSDASLTLQAGRTAFNHWRNLPKARRRLFILLLTFL